MQQRRECEDRQEALPTGRGKGRTSYACPHTHIHVDTCTCTQMHSQNTCSCVCTHIHVLHMHRFTHLYTRANLYVHTLMHAPIYTLLIHVYIDTHTHIYPLTHSCTLIHGHKTHTYTYAHTLPPRFRKTHTLRPFFIIMEVQNGHLIQKLLHFPRAILSTVFRNETSGCKVIYRH